MGTHTGKGYIALEPLSDASGPLSHPLRRPRHPPNCVSEGAESTDGPKQAARRLPVVLVGSSNLAHMYAMGMGRLGSYS